MNYRIVQIIKDAPAKTVAMHEVKRSERKAKSWFYKECQAQRTIYRSKRRKPLRENNEERKSAFRIYKSFLKRKKLFAPPKFNSELQRKTKRSQGKTETTERLQSAARKNTKAKSVLFKHFKNLNSATSPDPSNHENFSCETIDNLNHNQAFSLEKVISCQRKIQNGKSTGHDDVLLDFLKMPMNTRSFR